MYIKSLLYALLTKQKDNSAASVCKLIQFLLQNTFLEEYALKHLEDVRRKEGDKIDKAKDNGVLCYVYPEFDGERFCDSSNHKNVDDCSHRDETGSDDMVLCVDVFDIADEKVEQETEQQTHNHPQ